MANNSELVFTDKVLDNVHGFIPFTEAEGKIIDMMLFKRLQSIKQLSIVNWIFPGSEHTRYVHSLGVMHICDKIAKQLKLSNNQRRIVRFAGLLHDIGHYPLSHVCEYPYKESIEKVEASKFCQHVNTTTMQKIDSLSSKTKTDFMAQSNGGHHESVGAMIITNNEDIKRIIIDECQDENAIETICDMITGNVDREATDPLLVQILHSELDADGIDYMLRDSSFSGTSFGSFELDLLINCMTIREFSGKRILCITPKGIPAADQYLINKFFSYSQIVCNKHVAILEWMAETIVDWMQKNDTYFPTKERLNEWISGTLRQNEEYLSFTDNYFWNSINDIIKNPAKQTFPRYVIELCNNLLKHQELPYKSNSEIKVISRTIDEIKTVLTSSDSYKHLSVFNKHITLLNTKQLTKHVPYNIFEERMLEIQKIYIESNTESEIDETELKIHRLMDGICVYDPEQKEEIHLLCDDNRSLMRYLYGTQLVVLRAYEFPIETT